MKRKNIAHAPNAIMFQDFAADRYDTANIFFKILKFNSLNI